MVIPIMTSQSVKVIKDGITMGTLIPDGKVHETKMPEGGIIAT